MARKKTPAPADAHLDEDDLTPLLQAAASRSLDTCLRGARGLAVLHDPRAFGLLLQLSRENVPSARVEVCKALAALADPRAASRLRSLLHDSEASVRDAAFTALAKLQGDRPLEAAAAGLNAGHEDVRRRGLDALVRHLRGTKTEEAAAPGLDLLARALNDGAASVRSEAFKAALNLQVAGGGLRTMRFILRSVHADVRLEVLVAVLGLEQEPWARDLVLSFYNDPDANLRHEAFAAATGKDKELGPLEAALLAPYADVRKLAVEALIKKRTAPAQRLLVKALADEDKGVRQTALAALVGEDAREPLAAALSSPHDDVRVQAARALARHGERAALAPLLALASAPEPDQKERVPDWLALVESALLGLAELGDAGALADLTLLLKSGHASIRRLAAQALTWVAPPHHVGVLRPAVQHADPQVKYRAALGLAHAGDPLAASLVFSDQAAQVLTPSQRLVAALLLGQAAEDQFAVFLDADDTRNQALLLLMLLELADRQEAPARCLACLSARSARVRLAAARALERFDDPAAFRDHVVKLFNDRGDEPAWKIPPETISLLAKMLARGSVALRARAALLLTHLAEKEPSAWEQAWGVYLDRFAAEIAALKEKADPPTPAPQYTAEQLHELAFGAYVGLVREQGGSGGTEAQVIRVRQTALSRVLEMAKGGRQGAAVPVLMQALGDPNQAVRLQAFDQLAALGVDSDTLGAAALGAGHTDVGVKGLERLAGGGNSVEGQAVLEEALRVRTDDLATEAAKLLAARRGLVPVAGVALQAAYEPLRKQAVEWLAGEYDKEQARELLRQALHSRHRKVASAAAFALAAKKDAAAFEALVKLLGEAKEEGPQRRAIEALVGLGDARAADAFLDRIERDPEGSALAGELFDAAAGFRRPEIADRLLAMGKKRPQALGAALVVSGFDQEVEDPDEERSDRGWEQKQHPRHDSILARLLKQATEQKETRLLRELVAPARWARGKDVDAPLAVLSVHADDEVRRSAMEAIGWRLRKRGGPVEPLLRSLKARDPETQFLAAEGLARGGRGEGLSVLLAAVDLQEDHSLRERAVSALGELGDARALDLLLK
ncbi:MAG: HEAT repeat domain-containing protein, partial [Gemmataceae bacterium]|nr:HEAT repeat domain-containing protein [Gemmataceae bacterium]